MASKCPRCPQPRIKSLTGFLGPLTPGPSELKEGEKMKPGVIVLVFRNPKCSVWISDGRLPGGQLHPEGDAVMNGTRAVHKGNPTK